MIWSIKQHTFAECLQDWAELWLDDAYWHLLFSVILMVIMVLWRPTINNQRYAFSPLLDAADQEAEEPMMNDAFEGMKMRGLKAEGQVKPKEPASKVEDDLKWIEENIPASVADTALPSLLDSDEEIMTTKFEMSKME
ncbi:transmembrane protein 87A-like [Lingula anatina]|nr:transmembrane protein 87A-like [Lingula anatina]|eukprot:XP_013414567.1 transmembrane protein 87A-like [Lingula anatina]